MIRRGAHSGAPGTGGNRAHEGAPRPAAAASPRTGDTGGPEGAWQAALGGAACRIPVLFATYAVATDRPSGNRTSVSSSDRVQSSRATAASFARPLRPTSTGAPRISSRPLGPA